MIGAGTEEFGQWATSVMYSGWFYVILGAMGVFFFAMFICGVVWLFRRTDSMEQTSSDTEANPGFDYSPLLAVVGKLNGRPRRILLAAASLLDLPVTIPVNTAMRLAASKTCLLVDLDTQRDALAKVFEIASAAGTGFSSPLTTPVENLHILPAHYFSQRRQMDLKSLLTLNQKKYDVILLNAPYLATHPDRVQIVRSAESAVVFVKDKKTADTLTPLLEKGACKILKTLGPNGQPLA